MFWGTWSADKSYIYDIVWQQLSLDALLYWLVILNYIKKLQERYLKINAVKMLCLEEVMKGRNLFLIYFCKLLFLFIDEKMKI